MRREAGLEQDPAAMAAAPAATRPNRDQQDRAEQARADMPENRERVTITDVPALTAQNAPAQALGPNMVLEALDKGVQLIQAGLRAMLEQQAAPITVNVPPPVIHVAAPIVNVQPADVRVAVQAPAAPQVRVEPPVVHVHQPPATRPKARKIERDAEGNITRVIDE